MNSTTQCYPCEARWGAALGHLLFVDDEALLALLERDFQQHWSSLQPSVTRELAPQSLRLWFNARKLGSAPSLF